MPKQIREAELQEIEAIVGAHRLGASLLEIAHALTCDIPRRTLQYRLKYLVDQGRLIPDGEKRWMRYHVPVAETIRQSRDIHPRNYTEWRPIIRFTN